jgi:hypothetical protein
MGETAAIKTSARRADAADAATAAAKRPRPISTEARA